MDLIKLNATESTNTFLKELMHQKKLDDFTVVATDHQLNGRGQMGSSWISEKGKNLTFSVLVKFYNFRVENQFYISKVVSLALFYGLKELLGEEIKIKWPNDILAEKKKIAGVLIENSVKNNVIASSVIGVGLNVNQEVFDEDLDATSLKLVLGKKIDLDDLLHKMLSHLKHQITHLKNNRFDLINSAYIDNLINFNRPAMYRDLSGSLFMGKINGIAADGKLQVEMSDESTKEFGLKEIRFEF